MIEALPAIIEDTYDEVARKLVTVSQLVPWVQVDIADGIFVARTTWTRVEDLVSAPEGLNIDLHAMVADPLAFVRRIERIKQIQRITFHFEAAPEPLRVIQVIRETGREAGLAINPETAVDAVTSLVPACSVILMMGVHPGWGGQEYIASTNDRVRTIKQRWPMARVGVDGGIHLASGTAQQAVNAGADFLVAGSDIFNAPNPGSVVRELQRLIPNT